VQTEYANHLKVLQSKIVVLNVQVKMLCKQYQVSVKKLNIIEPLMKCRKGSSSCKSKGFPDQCDITVTDSCILVTGRPALRRQELYTGFYPERERLPSLMSQKLCRKFFLERLFNNVLQFILQLNSDEVGRCNKERRTKP
jgi:hypothetical protein